MFLMRVLEAVMAGGVVVGALAVWRPCSALSSRSLRVLRWVVVVIAAFGVARRAMAHDAVVNVASPPVGK